MGTLPRTSLALVLFALTASVLAGCVSTDDDDGADPRALRPDFASVLELTHETDEGHTIAAEHALASPNMELVSFHSLAGEGVEFVDGNAEVTYHEGYAYVATLGATSGFVIVDVSDPAAPQVVGRYSNPNVYSPDVKVSWEGDFAILSSHPGSVLQSHLPARPPVPIPGLPDALAYTEPDHVTGVTLVDISDKTAPTKVAFFPTEPSGTHNTEYAEIDGRDIIFTVDANKVQVLEIQGSPGGERLVAVATILADDKWREELPDRAGSTSPYAYLPASSHDVVYQQHPVTQDHLVYIAFGGAGFYIYNVNNPSAPSMVSNWRGLPEDSSYYHYAAPVDVEIDERHVTVVAPEVFNSETSAGTIAILDTTDPNQPEEIGNWTLPGDLLIEKNYRFSPHNFDIRNGILYLGSYHAGVWVLDLTCDDCLEEPQELGYYLPHEEPDRIVDGEQKCAFWCERPFVWGAVVDENGLIYASDVESGLYIIRLTPDDVTEE